MKNKNKTVSCTLRAATARYTYGRQTYRAIKVKLMLLLTNDQKTKNETKYNKDFLVKHILIHIIPY